MLDCSLAKWMKRAFMTIGLAYANNNHSTKVSDRFPVKYSFTLMELVVLVTLWPPNRSDACLYHERVLCLFLNKTQYHPYYIEKPYYERIPKHRQADKSWWCNCKLTYLKGHYLPSGRYRLFVFGVEKIISSIILHQRIGVWYCTKTPRSVGNEFLALITRDAHVDYYSL